MAQFIWLSIIFLPLLGYPCRSQVNEPRSLVNAQGHRKDTGYGRPVLAMANSPRCIFNGKPVEDGKYVSSPEPCLNCTCNKGILLCYLHTCNSIAPMPGCQIVKKPDTCCPELECGDSSTYYDYRTERTSEPSNKQRLRQDDNHFFGLFGMDPKTERSPTTKNPGVKGHRPNFSSFLKGISSQRRSDTYSGQHPYEQEEDIEEDELSPDQNETAAYCFSRGYKYTEGMAMLSPTKCEYCYCIGGQQMCVRPKCHLSIEGCVPRYQSGYTCCPSHYNCEIASGVSTLGNDENLKNHQMGSVNDTLKNKVTSCNVEGYDFDVGVAVPSNGHCQTCYCTQMGVVCRRLECSPSIPGCTPVIPEGHCCPTQYKCDQKNVNSSHVPVPHSTDNYDVTVISPLETEGTSSQTLRTDISDIYTEAAEHSPTTYVEDTESVTETSSEKQKITVELPGEADLESISVIPEENIAVLILTTEKGDDEGKATSAEITSHTSTREDITTKLVPTSVLNAKRKSRPTKTSTTISKIKNSTRLTTLNAATDPLTITTNRGETTQDSTDSTGKDNYTYDYEEFYDDEADTRETFSPFSDYSLTPFEETSSAESMQDGISTALMRHKIKQKKPSSSTVHHKFTTNMISPITTENQFSSYGNKQTEFIRDDSTFSTIARNDADEIVTVDSNKYTVHSSEKRKSPDTLSSLETLVTSPNIAQKNKKRRPGVVTKQSTSVRTQFTKPIQLVTGSGLTLEQIFNIQTLPIDTTTEKKTFAPYTAETNTQTYRPYVRPTHSTKKKISNRRRYPDSQQETTIIRKTTKPTPQDIADFLWSVTQMQNTQTPATSTEIEDFTTKKVKEASVSVETLPPIALAAPKLILETQTSENTRGTTEAESESETTNPSPNFNIRPEIIFSNHGPTKTRKQPTIVKEPEVPLIINNHKRVSTRLRPPIRFRPDPTPPTSVEDTFVEISNHRPTSVFRRPPPNSFPPYPHVVSRPDGSYHRDSHPKLIESDVPLDWTEDYEEYFYNSEDHTTLTKIFNNIQAHQSTRVHTGTSSTESFSDDLKTTTSVPATDSSFEGVTSTVEITEQTNVNQNSDSINTDTYGNDADKTTEPSVITEIPTTPAPKTTNYVPTVTTTTPVDTTKSFSGYVRNKYKGISSHIHDNEPKFFRADDDAETKRRESDFRFIEYGKKPSEFMSYSEKLSQRSTSTTPMPTQPPKEQEETQEITDVCFVDGRYYTSGETIIKSNPCEMCRCFYGHPLCQVQQCPPPPDPSCALDYLPGYCCPRVTCGLETDPDQPLGIVSPPEPTSQEIRRSDNDNQWKPLPHGPLLRTTESAFKTDSTHKAHKKPDVQPIIETFVEPEIQTAPPPTISNIYVWAGDSKKESAEPVTETQVTTVTTTTVETTTTEKPATTISTTVNQPPTTSATNEETTQPQLPTEITYSAEEIPTTLPPFTTVTVNFDDIIDPYTTVPLKPLEPIFDHNSEEHKGPQNKSGIHDNSSGVRKILDEVITLPPSKVELSLSDVSNISTVLPVIVTMPTVAPVDESDKEPVTMFSADLGAVTELGGNLKISGCNVYGKYYRINDKVSDLSKPCSDCICSADGIVCNATC
ncbi:uncharacterized protein TNIN_88701 [Trichonephila inaurata madagascariensis]|uniref:VWFC domain-containing protein n=1 Tax=Trichonephila inaurata madagascariensis TaxID=2747483 RepID=A0A8X6XUK6_9ARAC|nr:uncharacterized protein TNIN_88701 [Trichonephila inaurata madagascariensis]